MINDASGEKDYCLVFTLKVFLSLLGFVKCLFYFFFFRSVSLCQGNCSATF